MNTTLPSSALSPAPVRRSALRTLSRRDWLGTGLVSAAGAGFAWADLEAAERSGGQDLRLGTFRFDVTPPEGHPLCGGWIVPVKRVEDPLEAIGFVLLGAGDPIVVCAVDWTGILNEAHVAWREALARAAGASPERVAVQCLHQHDAPFACLASERLVSELDAGLAVVDPGFFQSCLDRGAAAVAGAVKAARPLTHVATGEARVIEVAGNRRVDLGPDGQVRRMRGSSCRDPELIALPEGLIDPMLKTVAFYSGKEKILACHYYACHPMSHYGRGEVSSDFPGLARKRRQAEEPGCAHIYFTGCAGNIGAGKYNDGSPEARARLAERIYRAMAESEKTLAPAPVEKVSWSWGLLQPPVNPVFTEEGELAQVHNPDNSLANRIRPAMRVSWIRRTADQVPIVLSALHVNRAALLHLPAESFVEYQIRAQELGADRFVATAAYGDGGPWYIPVKEAYPQGGYEVSVANCSDAVDDQMSAGIRTLLASAAR